MSDDDDLFGSSDGGGDTDDLIAESQKSKPIAKPKQPKKKLLGGAKKKRLQKKAAGNNTTKKNTKKRTRIPDADNDDDDDDVSLSAGKPAPKKKKDDDDDDGLFDDSDDDNEAATAKPTKPLSKKERMEALMKRKRQASSSSAPSSEKKKKNKNKDKDKDKRSDTKSTKEGAGEDEYDSEDSYNSVNFERTQADNDFIDMDDDDQDAINELYAEQHFDDERPEGEDSDADDDGPRRKSKKSSSSKPRGPDSLSAEDKADQDNPIMQAVMKMQKKKRTPKKTSELEEDVKEFLNKMEEAADLDDKALEQRQPATRKLQMLGHVVDTLTRKDIMRALLDFDVLSVCKRWIQPLPHNGALGNVTVRQRIIDCISNMKGESGINAHDLKKSGFGKVIMSLYMHKSETPTLKRQLKSLIEQWSRPIFQKSGDMRDLEHAHATRGVNSLVGIARQQQQQQSSSLAAAAGGRRPQGGATGKGRGRQDIHSIIASGSTKGKADGGPGVNRVRVPYSKGFQYTVRPTDKTGTVTDKRMAMAGPNDKRAHLSKRMVEKGRAANKNQRSANISIEGRPTK